MDNFVKKRMGIFLLVVIGGLALPLGELIAIAPIPIMWKWYLAAILAAGVIFGEEYVRHLFKISKESTALVSRFAWLRLLDNSSTFFFCESSMEAI